MKIVADKHIPFLEGVFEPYADVVYIDGRQINHNDIIDADQDAHQMQCCPSGRYCGQYDSYGDHRYGSYRS